MTIFGAITAALLRKVSAFVTECRKLVAEATAVEEKIVGTAKAKVKAIIAQAKAEEKQVVTQVKTEVGVLKEDLVSKIAKL